MHVTEDDVRKMASLSMIEIDDSEIENFRVNLEAILSHVMKLNELDTENVEPTTYILDAVNVLRDDVPEKEFSKQDLLKNAPEKEDDAFIVPRVVE